MISIRVDGILVYFDAVFVAPLLPLLADAVLEGDDTVIPQTMDKRLGDIRTGRDGADARQVGYLVDHITRCGVLIDIGLAHGYNGDRCALQQGRLAYASNHYFIGFHGGDR